MCMAASVCSNYVHGYVSKTTILRVSLADSDPRTPVRDHGVAAHPLAPFPLRPEQGGSQVGL